MTEGPHIFFQTKYYIAQLRSSSKYRLNPTLSVQHQISAKHLRSCDTLFFRYLTHSYNAIYYSSIAICCSLHHVSCHQLSVPSYHSNSIYCSSDAIVSIVVCHLLITAHIVLSALSHFTLYQVLFICTHQSRVVLLYVRSPLRHTGMCKR